MSQPDKQPAPDCLAAIFKSCDFCFAILGEDGRIIETSPGLGKLLGCPASELSGKQFSGLLTTPSPQDPLSTEARLKNFFEKPFFIYNARLVRHDGAAIEVRIISRHAAGTGCALVEIVPEDLLPAGHDEAAVRAREEQFRALTESTFDAILSINSQGLITFWNRGARGIFGYEASEVLGKPVSLLLPEHLREQDTRSMQTALRSGVSLTNAKPLEQLYRHKDGREFIGEFSRSAWSAGGELFISAVVRNISERKQVECDLRESEQRFRVLANSAPDAIIFLDSQGKIIFWNQGAQKMYGYEYKEMLGKTPESIMPRDFFGNRGQGFMLQPGEPAGFPDRVFESFGIRKDGTRFPAEISLSSGRAGAALFSCAIVRNISERKKVERALRESEERFRVLAESLPEGIIAVDGKGSIVFWNTGAQNLFGYTRDEVLGKPSTMLAPERYRLAEQEGLRALQQQGFSAFQGRILQGVGRRKDGTEFADEISSGPWPTQQGLYYVAIIRDITERLRAEQALRESEQRFKELADTLPQSVFELDLNGMITLVNRTALDAFGYSQSDIDKGMHALHMIVPEQRITVRGNIEKVFAGERLGGQEYMALRKDGTTFPCIIHASPIMADGKQQGLRGLLIDITLRKELEEQMNKANRLASIATLAGGVAQDFNTILSIILGNINLAQHQVAPEDRVSEHLSAAERATLRAKDLTDQLIAFSKGGTALKTTLSVEKLLRDAADTALKGSNVTCRFSFPPDLRLTELDEMQMRQVFINLLINADHAMPEGGSIDVSAANITVGPGDNLPLPNGPYVKITISDQSIGILNEHLQQLFDPYFTSRQRGSGIGLATTYTIIKNHGGLITVESEFGSGTTFHIFLPAGTSKN